VKMYLLSNSNLQIGWNISNILLSKDNFLCSL
jgi:hypothetical protein